MNEPIDGTFQKLNELAQNLWWSWQPDIRAIFRELDPETWSLVYHNPVALLQRVPPEDIARRVHDLEMQTRINQAHRRLQSYLHGGESWGVVHAGPILARPVGPIIRLGRWIRRYPVGAGLIASLFLGLVVSLAFLQSVLAQQRAAEQARSKFENTRAALFRAIGVSKFWENPDSTIPIS